MRRTPVIDAKQQGRNYVDYLIIAREENLPDEGDVFFDPHREQWGDQFKLFYAGLAEGFDEKITKIKADAKKEAQRLKDSQSKLIFNGQSYKAQRAELGRQGFTIFRKALMAAFQGKDNPPEEKPKQPALAKTNQQQRKKRKPKDDVPGDGSPPSLKHHKHEDLTAAIDDANHSEHGGAAANGPDKSRAAEKVIAMVVEEPAMVAANATPANTEAAKADQQPQATPITTLQANVSVPPSPPEIIAAVNPSENGGAAAGPDKSRAAEKVIAMVVEEPAMVAANATSANTEAAKVDQQPQAMPMLFEASVKEELFDITQLDDGSKAIVASKPDKIAGIFEKVQRDWKYFIGQGRPDCKLDDVRFVEVQRKAVKFIVVQVRNYNANTFLEFIKWISPKNTLDEWQTNGKTYALTKKEMPTTQEELQAVFATVINKPRYIMLLDKFKKGFEQQKQTQLGYVKQKGSEAGKQLILEDKSLERTYGDYYPDWKNAAREACDIEVHALMPLVKQKAIVVAEQLAAHKTALDKEDFATLSDVVKFDVSRPGVQFDERLVTYYRSELKAAFTDQLSSRQIKVEVELKNRAKKRVMTLIQKGEPLTANELKGLNLPQSTEFNSLEFYNVQLKKEFSKRQARIEHTLSEIVEKLIKLKYSKMPVANDEFFMDYFVEYVADYGEDFFEKRLHPQIERRFESEKQRLLATRPVVLLEPTEKQHAAAMLVATLPATPQASTTANALPRLSITGERYDSDMLDEASRVDLPQAFGGSSSADTRFDDEELDGVNLRDGRLSPGLSPISDARSVSRLVIQPLVDDGKPKSHQEDIGAYFSSAAAAAFAGRISSSLFEEPDPGPLSGTFSVGAAPNALFAGADPNAVFVGADPRVLPQQPANLPWLKPQADGSASLPIDGAMRESRIVDDCAARQSLVAAQASTDTRIAAAPTKPQARMSGAKVGLFAPKPTEVKPTRGMQELRSLEDRATPPRKNSFYTLRWQHVDPPNNKIYDLFLYLAGKSCTTSFNERFELGELHAAWSLLLVGVTGNESTWINGFNSHVKSLQLLFSNVLNLEFSTLQRKGEEVIRGLAVYFLPIGAGFNNENIQIGYKMAKDLWGKLFNEDAGKRYHYSSSKLMSQYNLEMQDLYQQHYSEPSKGTLRR